MQVSDEDIFEVMLEIRREIKELTRTMDRRFSELDMELHGYRMVMRVVRWLGAITIAIITFRFGDIKNLF